MSTAPAERPPNPVQVFRHELGGMEDEFRAALPAHIPVERFARVVMTAVQTNPELLECERRSLWNAATRAAQDGLLPDGREGAMVVRRDSQRGKVANWQPMILGIRKKARNSGEIATWDAHLVREKDEFDVQLGDAPHIHHRFPSLKVDRGPIIGAYSIATLKDQSQSFEIMSIAEIHAIRDRSDAWRAYKAGRIKTTPWATDEGEMARKTVARRHSKVLPMSSDLDDLIRRDDELYHFDDAKKDEAEAPRDRPKTLARKLDRLAVAAPSPSDAAPGDPPASGPAAPAVEPDVEDLEPEDEAPRSRRPRGRPPKAAPASEAEAVPGEPVETDERSARQEPSEPAGMDEASAPMQGEPTDPATFTAADKARLREYHKILEGALSQAKLSKLSGDFWRGELPAEGSRLHEGMVAILGAHARRISGEGSIADADNIAREWST